MSEEEFRKIAQEEMAKQIRENIDSALIFKYVSELEEKVKKQDKMIDLMAEEMKNKEYEYEDMCLYSEDCHGEYCEKCIKEYFRKKVENEN